MILNKFFIPAAVIAVAAITVNVVGDDPEKFPYTEDVKEYVVNDNGKRAVRIIPDETLNSLAPMKNRKNCFILMSKKDYYLYVYEAQGEGKVKDTVMLARFDCCFGRVKGNKQKRGDMKTPHMKTPHCTLNNPFTISQIQNASSWTHNFGDGRGAIKAYGNYFLRLVTPGHSGIGIHGSTNNEGSVPGRASEGCIRLRDADIITLAKTYAFQGMKVYIKDEKADDLPFEIRAMRKQNIERRRHLNPQKVLTNEQIQSAPLQKANQNNALNLSFPTNNMTLEEYRKSLQ